MSDIDEESGSYEDEAAETVEPTSDQVWGEDGTPQPVSGYEAPADGGSDQVWGEDGTPQPVSGYEAPADGASDQVWGEDGTPQPVSEEY